MSLWKRIVSLTQTANEPTPTEHGWRTERVIATRYKNPHMSYNIGFQFPENPYDCDAKELFDFIQNEGNGRIYQGGGYPGAEVFAVFEAVKDQDSANAFLTGGFLERLDTFVRDNLR